MKGSFVKLRKRFRLAFEKSLGQPVGHVSTSLLWKNQRGIPQVLEMVCYQDGDKFRQSPPFFRASVNFRPPPHALTGFWTDRDDIDTRGPNANIEITVMPEEAEALAEWLPHWLRHREGLAVDFPAPPKGLEALPHWTPKLEHVYLWSVKADEAYSTWKRGQQCHQA
jgi:hypothetical protein